MADILTNYPWLLPACVFVSVSLAAWTFADFFAEKNSKSEERLRRIQSLSPTASIVDEKQRRRDEIKQWVDNTSASIA